MIRRGLGKVATSPLLLSSALEPFLTSKSSKKDPRVGADGAGNIADVVSIVAASKDAVIDDNRAVSHERTSSRVAQAAAYADLSEKAAAAPGDLEDLSGGIDFGGVDVGVNSDEIADLRSEVRARLDQVRKTVAASQKAADLWTKRCLAFKGKGNHDGAAKAERNADGHRARMHAALAEMAQLQEELKELERAAAAPPPKKKATSGSSTRRGGGTSVRQPRQSVDDMLEQLKREQGVSAKSKKRAPRKKRKASTGSAVDDELAALKRKMAKDKRKK
jgi:hypothetical protein